MLRRLRCGTRICASAFADAAGGLPRFARNDDEARVKDFAMEVFRSYFPIIKGLCAVRLLDPRIYAVLARGWRRGVVMQVLASMHVMLNWLLSFPPLLHSYSLPRHAELVSASESVKILK